MIINYWCLLRGYPRYNMSIAGIFGIEFPYERYILGCHRVWSIALSTHLCTFSEIKHAN